LMAKQAEELMALAVEAAQSRSLPVFLEQFAQRSARMLGALWGGVAVHRGRETELYSATGAKDFVPDAGKSWLIGCARESRSDVEALAVPKDMAASLERTVEPTAVVLVRIAGSENEKLGTLCLLRNRKHLDAGEKRLLHALASHAALSLENFRRFSQLERSKRQWVEDIDAISDYIVVHDRA
jgi:GAF domain-containing protein